MQCLWKKLLIILFLNSIFFGQLQAIEIKNIKLLILDKSSSSKYELEFSNSYQFRNLSFELVSCKNIELHKWILNQNDFINGVYNTNWLEKNISKFN